MYMDNIKAPFNNLAQALELLKSNVM